MTLHGPRARPTAAQPGASGAAGFVRGPALVGGRASAPPEARGISIGLAARTESGWDVRDRARRHRGPIREACVCGGPDIVAVTFLPHDIVAAVQRHQIEPVHIAYDVAHRIPLAAWQLVAPR